MKGTLIQNMDKVWPASPTYSATAALSAGAQTVSLGGLCTRLKMRLTAGSSRVHYSFTGTASTASPFLEDRDAFDRVLEAAVSAVYLYNTGTATLCIEAAP